MKRLAAISVFAATGLTAGWLASWLVLAFSPACGYDCDNKAIGTFFAIVTGFSIGFPSIGHILTRGELLTRKRVSVITIGLTGITLLAAVGFYVAELHKRYTNAEAALPITANFDFMYMSIATRDVQTYTKAANGLAKPAGVIPQWQRCAVDGAWCDQRPRQAHMLCKSGEVYVNENDWRAFSLIPGENLKGAVSMKSMNLCAPDNIPD